MIRRHLSFFGFLWCILFGLGPHLNAQDEKEELVLDSVSRTEHSIDIEGQKIRYQALAGKLVLKTEKDDPKAAIFYTSYTKLDEKDQSARPISFVFNGGPGSASVWLHMGLLGPKRIALQNDGTMTRPPGKLVDNEYSLLDKTDLVFIDPVSTGFSRTVGDGKESDYHGFDGDIQSVASFIRLYVTRHKRWLSPKFIIGESYGTTRAAGLSTVLQEDYGMYLNGLALISSVLQFQTIRFYDGNDLPFLLFFPSYTATAYFHKKLDKRFLDMPLEDLLKISEDFTVEELAPALLRGNSLGEDKKRRLIKKASRLSGLSESFIQDSRFRIDSFEFMKELLRSKSLTVGRLDSRFTGTDKRNYGERYEYDPSNAQILGPYAAGINGYLRNDLKFETDLSYEVLSSKVHPWDYSRFRARYVDVSERLRRSLNLNPHLKVYIASGYYDLATPYFATDYTVRNLGLNDSLTKNIRVKYYRAGHMMYIHLDALKKQKSDMSKFIDWSLGE